MRGRLGIVLLVVGSGGLAQPARVKWSLTLPNDAHDVRVSALLDGSFAVCVPRSPIGSEASVELRKISAKGENEWTLNEPFVSADLLVYPTGDIGMFGLDLFGAISVRRVGTGGTRRWVARDTFYIGVNPQRVTAKLGPDDWVYLGGIARIGEAVRGNIFAVDSNGYPRWTAQANQELGIGAEIAGVGSNNDVIFISNQFEAGAGTAYPVRLRGLHDYRRLEATPFASLNWLASSSGSFFRAGTRNGSTGYVEKVDLEMNPIWATSVPRPVQGIRADSWGNVVSLLANGNLVRIRPDGSVKTATAMPYGADYRGVVDFALDKYGRHTILANSRTSAKLYFGDAWTPVRWSLALAGPARALAVGRSSGDSVAVVTDPLSGKVMLQCVEQVPEPLDDTAKAIRSQLQSGNVLTNDRYVGTGTAEVVEGPVRCSVAFSPSGAYSYQAYPGFLGRDIVRYRIVKPGLTSVVGTLRIEVVP